MREWLPIPVLLPGKSHGQRNVVGYNPWSCRVGHNLATNTFTFYIHGSTVYNNQDRDTT